MNIKLLEKKFSWNQNDLNQYKHIKQNSLYYKNIIILLFIIILVCITNIKTIIKSKSYLE